MITLDFNIIHFFVSFHIQTVYLQAAVSIFSSVGSITVRFGLGARGTGLGTGFGLLKHSMSQKQEQVHLIMGRGRTTNL